MTTPITLRQKELQLQKTTAIPDSFDWDLSIEDDAKRVEVEGVLNDELLVALALARANKLGCYMSVAEHVVKRISAISDANPEFGLGSSGVNDVLERFLSINLSPKFAQIMPFHQVRSTSDTTFSANDTNKSQPDILEESGFNRDKQYCH